MSSYETALKYGLRGVEQKADESARRRGPGTYKEALRRGPGRRDAEWLRTRKGQQWLANQNTEETRKFQEQIYNRAITRGATRIRDPISPVQAKAIAKEMGDEVTSAELKREIRSRGKYLDPGVTIREEPDEQTYSWWEYVPGSIGLSLATEALEEAGEAVGLKAQDEKARRPTGGNLQQYRQKALADQWTALDDAIEEENPRKRLQKKVGATVLSGPFQELTPENQKEWLSQYWEEFSGLPERQKNSIIRRMRNHAVEQFYKAATGEDGIDYSQMKTPTELKARRPVLREGMTAFVRFFINRSGMLVNVASSLARNRTSPPARRMIARAGGRGQIKTTTTQQQLGWKQDPEEGIWPPEERQEFLEWVGLSQGRTPRTLTGKLTSPNWYAAKVGENLPFLALSMAGPPGWAAIGALEAASHYEDRVNKVGPSQAALEAMPVGLVNTALEGLAFGHLWSLSDDAVKAGLKAGRRSIMGVVKDIGIQGLVEGSEEIGQETMSAVAAQIGGDADQTLMEYGKAVVQSGVVGAMMGAGMGGVSSGIGRVRETNALDVAANQTVDMMEQMKDIGVLTEDAVERIRGMVERNEHRDSYEKFKKRVKQTLGPTEEDPTGIARTIDDIPVIVEETAKNAYQDLPSVLRGFSYVGNSEQTLERLLAMREQLRGMRQERETGKTELSPDERARWVEIQHGIEALRADVAAQRLAQQEAGISTQEAIPDQIEAEEAATDEQVRKIKERAERDIPDRLSPLSEDQKEALWEGAIRETLGMVRFLGDTASRENIVDNYGQDLNRNYKALVRKASENTLTPEAEEAIYGTPAQQQEAVAEAQEAAEQAPVEEQEEEAGPAPEPIEKPRSISEEAKDIEGDVYFRAKRTMDPKEEGLIPLTQDFYTAQEYAIGRTFTTFENFESAIRSGELREASRKIEAVTVHSENTLDLTEGSTKYSILGNLDAQDSNRAQKIIDMSRKVAEGNFPTYLWWQVTQSHYQQAWKDVIIPQLQEQGYDAIKYKDDIQTGETLAVFSKESISPLKTQPEDEITEINRRLERGQTIPEEWKERYKIPETVVPEEGAGPAPEPTEEAVEPTEEPEAPPEEAAAEGPPVAEPDLEKLPDEAKIQPREEGVEGPVGQQSRTSTRSFKKETRFRIVPADQLVTSHSFGGARNPYYPDDLQQRSKTRQSQEENQRIVREFDPERLARPAPGPSAGMPTISEEGLVESGNSRVLAVRKIYQNYPEKARQYKRWLIQNAESLGFNPKTVQQMDQPVLVQERIEGFESRDQRVQFTREANQQITGTLGAAAQARTDAKYIPIESLDKVEVQADGTLPSTTNNAFVANFLNNLPGEERAALTTERGDALTPIGQQRMRAAILVRVYWDEQVSDERLNTFAQIASTNGAELHIKNVVHGLVSNADIFSRVRKALEKGNVEENVNPMPVIIDAIYILKRARTLQRTSSTDYNLHQAINEVTREYGMFEGRSMEYQNGARTLASYLANNLKSKKKAEGAFRDFGHYMMGANLEEAVPGVQTHMLGEKQGIEAKLKGIKEAIQANEEQQSVPERVDELYDIPPEEREYDKDTARRADPAETSSSSRPTVELNRTQLYLDTAEGTQLSPAGRDGLSEAANRERQNLKDSSVLRPEEQQTVPNGSETTPEQAREALQDRGKGWTEDQLIDKDAEAQRQATEAETEQARETLDEIDFEDRVASLIETAEEVGFYRHRNVFPPQAQALYKPGNFEIRFERFTQVVPIFGHEYGHHFGQRIKTQGVNWGISRQELNDLKQDLSRLAREDEQDVPITSGFARFFKAYVKGQNEWAGTTKGDAYERIEAWYEEHHDQIPDEFTDVFDGARELVHLYNQANAWQTAERYLEPFSDGRSKTHGWNSFGDVWQSGKKVLWSAYDAVWDNAHVINRIEDRLGYDKHRAYIAARQLAGTPSRCATYYLAGPGKAAQPDIPVPGVRSPAQILSDLKELDDHTIEGVRTQAETPREHWDVYAQAKRALNEPDYIKEQLPMESYREQVNYYESEAFPYRDEFLEAAKDSADYGEAFLRNIAVPAGILTSEEVDTIVEKHPWYTKPFFRKGTLLNMALEQRGTEGGEGTRARPSSGLYRMKGSEYQFGGYAENWAQWVQNVTRAADYHRFLRELSRTAEKKGAGQYIRRLAPKSAPTSIHADELRQKIRQKAREKDANPDEAADMVDDLMAILEEDSLEFWKTTSRQPDHRFAIKEDDGSLTWYSIEDAGLRRFFDNHFDQVDSDEEVHWMWKLARGAADVQRAAIVDMPRFALFRNLPRDIQTGWLYGRMGIVERGKNAAADAVHLTKAYYGKQIDPEVFKYGVAGGLWSDIGALAIEMQHGGGQAWLTAESPFSTPLKTFSASSSALEGANRMPEFREARKALQEEDLDPWRELYEAGLEAEDITVPFRREPGSKSLRRLSRYVPFMRASLHGVEKAGRTYWQAGAEKVGAVRNDGLKGLTESIYGDTLRGKVLERTAMMYGTQFLINALAWYVGDDDYREEIMSMPPWLRAKRWSIPTPWDKAPIAGLPDNVLSFPAPFLPGTLSVGAANMTTDRLIYGKPGMIMGWGEQIATQIPPPLIPTIMSIPMEMFLNVDLFTSRFIPWDQRLDRITPDYLKKQGIPPDARWDRFTSPTTRWIAQVVPEVIGDYGSPMQLQHAIESMFGYSGKAALDVSDTVIRSFTNEPASARSEAKYWSEIGYSEVFNRWQRDFFDYKSRLEQGIARVNHADNRGSPTKQLRQRYRVVPGRGRTEWRYADPERQRMYDYYQKVRQRITELMDKRLKISTRGGSQEKANQIDRRIEQLYKQAVQRFENSEVFKKLDGHGIYKR